MGPDLATETRTERLARPVIVVAASLVACQLVLAGRYGWHRDELYFLACSRHLAWGFVDQPPFTPAVARVATALFGTSLYGLRLAPALADTGMVVLAAVIARELGGGRSAQVLAATAVAISGVLLATGHLLATATFDFLAWTALTAIVVHVWRTGRTRWWIVAGVVAGVGLENKHSVAFLLVGLGVGMLVARRDLLRDPWLWAGLGIALVLWAPNLAWEASHGWPVVEMSRSLHRNGVRDANMSLFLPLQLVFLNPIVTPIWIAGLVWLFRSPAGRPYRPLAVAWVALAVGFIVTAGKPYYIAGVYPALLAAGSVWLEARWRPASVRRYLAAVAAVGVIATPLSLPVLPAGAEGSGIVAGVNPELRETYGWSQFAGTVARVPGPIVFTQNYGEAGALQHFAPGRPIYSGHNSYWQWGPPPDAAQPVVVVGDFSAPYLALHFRDCVRAATIDNPAHVPNQERGAGVWTCAGPVQPWHIEWPSLRHYNA
jgi:hypothetical protein